MTADPDIAALAYDAARRALAEVFEAAMKATMKLTAGKAVGGPLSAESPDGTDPAKAPPPADGPGIDSGGKGGETGTPEARPDTGLLDRTAAPASPAISALDLRPPSSNTAAASLSVKEAEAATAAQRAALEAAQDREDAVRGSNILTALQQGTLGPKAVKALGAKWPIPRGVAFGTRDSSLIARLQKAGTIAVGRWCRTHDIKEGE